MRIQSINYINNNKAIQNQSKRGDRQNFAIQSACYNPVYYKDYNIFFTGRTPENFYAQDFNRNNMPTTMKDYLFYDYENRQHIPPEQMMQEVFKYIQIADDFKDVKSIYPNEDLFTSLHDKPKNTRKGILTEIQIAKTLTDTPLLKDGNDNFGMYLLKKIYLEGKTLKEIQKDFYEKDINEDYKGIITEPIQYSTLDAYGIDYPNQAFWHSFINTRDEYKKFFVKLPQNSALPGVNVSAINNSASNIDNNSVGERQESKYPKRRFIIKPHKKKEIQNDLLNKKCTDIEFVKKTIRKRFGNDNPEASFIVRYMSPIMTIAADRAHMSEEMKAFAQYEREKGKTSDEETMFGRFWKNNPKMLEVFSAGITDTIDMFEDIYGQGGNIPINTDLEAITDKTQNKKIIDFVSPEFLELLSYAKDIDVLRNEKYILHDELQKQWNEHFINRYGEAVSDNTDIKPVELPKTELSQQQRNKIESEKDGANVYKLRLKDGNYVYITSDFDEKLKGQLKHFAMYFPTKYAQKYIKSTLAQDFSDKFKLTFVAEHNNLCIPENEKMEFDDEKLQTREEFKDEFYKLVKFNFDNTVLEHAARFALVDTMQSVKDINIDNYGIYNKNIYYIDDSIVADDSGKKEFNSILLANKKNIDRRFDSYSTPLTSSEMNKVMLKFFDMISKYEPGKTILENKDTVVMISMLKDALKIERNYQSCYGYFNQLFKIDTFVKSLLYKNVNEDAQRAKFEAIMDYLSNLTIGTIRKAPDIMVLFDIDIYSKYRNNLSPETRKIFDDAFHKLSPDARKAFFLKEKTYNPEYLFYSNPDLYKN